MCGWLFFSFKSLSSTKTFIFLIVFILFYFILLLNRSLGVVLYTLTTGNMPFFSETNNSAEVFMKIMRSPVWYPAQMSPDLRNLLEGMWMLLYVCACTCVLEFCLCACMMRSYPAQLSPDLRNLLEGAMEFSNALFLSLICF